YYDRVVSRNASMHLHSTATGVAVSGRGSATIGDDHFPTYGFLADVDEDEMLATLLTAAACLGTIAHVVYEEWGINSEEVSAANEGAQTAVLRLSPSKRRSLGRNDPCWCGS